ncbi:hypothetical protein [Pontibacter chinhatensis]|nr:hypothetical protein [Pontibacter chinhatensis]
MQIREDRKARVANPRQRGIGVLPKYKKAQADAGAKESISMAKV